MNFATMKVSTRLMLGFCVMLALVVLTGLWSLRSAQHTADLLRGITVEDYKSELDIRNIRALMETNRSQVLQLLQHNPSTEYAKWHDHPMDLHYKNITDATTELNNLWAKYEKSLRTPEDLRLATDWFEKTKGLGLRDVDRLVTSVKANQWDAAESALIKGINPSYRDGDMSLKALREHFGARKAENELAVDEGLRHNTVVLLSMLGCSLVIAIVLVVFLIRMMDRQLGGEPSDAREFSSQIAKGNLAQSIQLRANDRESVLFAMSTMQAGLADVVSQVRTGSESVLAASQEIARGNQDLNSRTETQSSALQQTSVLLEELSSTVAQNAESAALANQLATSASSLATDGGRVVSRVVENMGTIQDSAKKIGDIIGVIDSIAFQTNILALNAAVEAARAGEQGRGFAVVASEVRTLARRSAEAAKEIRGLISTSVERVEQGSKLVDQAGVTMTDIVTAIQKVSSVAGKISLASQRQSEGVAQVGAAITQLDQTTQQNAALVEEVAAAASSLNGQAEKLVQAVAVFNLEGGGPQNLSSGLLEYQDRAVGHSLNGMQGLRRLG